MVHFLGSHKPLKKNLKYLNEITLSEVDSNRNKWLATFTEILCKQIDLVT